MTLEYRGTENNPSRTDKFVPCRVSPCCDIAALSIMNTGCRACLSRRLCIAGALDETQALHFEQAIHQDKPKRKGKHLYWQDNTFKSIFIIRSGAVKTYRISECGKERVLGFHLPGEMIGLDGLYKERYANSAIALDTTVVCELTFETFLTLLSESSHLQMRFLSGIYGEVLAEQNKHFLDARTAEEKVAAFLLNLSQRYRCRNHSASTFQLLMTRRDIANYLGMAVETVSRVLTRFQQRGWLVISGRDVTVKNTAAIEALLVDCKDELLL